jgi:ribose 5-phosphate isomerase B
MIQKIAVGNDHGGFIEKKIIIQYLRELGYEVLDFGSDDEHIVRYPYYAALIADAVIRDEAQRGILICSTGIGMSIAANKYKGIKASLCTNAYMAKMTRQHNNSNVLCLGGKISTPDELIDIVTAWLENDFIGGRHQISLDMIQEIEDATMKDCVVIPCE